MTKILAQGMISGKTFKRKQTLYGRRKGIKPPGRSIKTKGA